MLLHYIVVGLGGATGAIARLALAKILPPSLMGIPIPILCINILGCFIMGFLVELMALHWSVSMNMRSFLTAGLLGGFTTFSAFALEFGLLFDRHHYMPAFVYATLSVVLSIAFFFVGMKIVRTFS